MEREITHLNLLTLAGISVRTNNKDEMDAERAKIGMLMGKYWRESIANKFPHRINPGKTYAVYCEFEQQDQAEYTYFIGEEIAADSTQAMNNLQMINIQPGRYQKMTSEEGPLPNIVIQSWQEIWQMKATDFAGQRSFKTDFEVYDHRCANPEKAIIDLYIGIA